MTEEQQQKTAKEQRRVIGNPFPKGVSGNPNGRPKETEEQKAIKKAKKELIKDYTDKLASALPKISPVLIEMAVSGDIKAIKEINDRVMGKPKDTLEVSGELPVRVIRIKRMDAK